MTANRNSVGWVSFFAGLLVGVSSCVSNSTADANGDGRLKAYCDDFAKMFAQEAVNNGYADSVDGYLDRFYPSPIPECYYLQVGVQASYVESIAVDSQAAAQCHAAVSAYLRGDEVDLSSCYAVLVGLVSNGGACRSSRECADEASYCGGTSCPGVCTRRLPDGAPVESGGVDSCLGGATSQKYLTDGGYQIACASFAGLGESCGEFEFCNYEQVTGDGGYVLSYCSPFTSLCSPAPTLNQRCAFEDDAGMLQFLFGGVVPLAGCASPNLYCNARKGLVPVDGGVRYSVVGSMLCEERVEIGGACDKILDNCALDAACAADAGCIARSGPGEQCLVAPDFVFCRDGLYCMSTTQTCVPFPGLGESCGNAPDFIPCASGFTCRDSNVCEPTSYELVGVGGDCGSGAIPLICKEDLVCVDNTCRVPEYKHAGESCAGGMLCELGLYCDSQALLCNKRVRDGESCTRYGPVQCYSGSSCVAMDGGTQMACVPTEYCLGN